MFLEVFASGSFIVLGFMTIGFLISKILKLTSTIDVLWPLGPLFFCYYLLPKPFSLENRLLFFCLLAWSLRLSIFIFWTRIRKKHEDARYKEILPTKNSIKKDLLVYFQFIFQGLLQILISLSFFTFLLEPNKTLLFYFWSWFYFGSVFYMW